jgi:hypothetical protein
MFRFKREEVTEDWRKEYKEESHNLYLSPYVDRIVKSGAWSE